MCKDNYYAICCELHDLKRIIYHIILYAKLDFTIKMLSLKILIFLIFYIENKDQNTAECLNVCCLIFYRDGLYIWFISSVSCKQIG